MLAFNPSTNAKAYKIKKKDQMPPSLSVLNNSLEVITICGVNTQNRLKLGRTLVLHVVFLTKLLTFLY